jgi:hypothetical protein
MGIEESDNFSYKTYVFTVLRIYNNCHIFTLYKSVLFSDSVTF